MMIALTLIPLYLVGVYFFTRLNYRMLDKEYRRWWPERYQVDRYTSEEDVKDRIRETKLFALVAGFVWPLGTPVIFFMTRDYSRWPDLLGWIK